MPCMVMLHISLPPLFLNFQPFHAIRNFHFLLPTIVSLSHDFLTMTSLQVKESDDKKAKTTTGDDQQTSEAPPSYANTLSELMSKLGGDNVQSDAASLAPS